MMLLESEQQDQIFDSLSKFQGEVEPIFKNNKVTFDTKNGASDKVKYNYADLADVIEVCKGPLSKYGLCITQYMAVIDGQSYVMSKLGHKSGQWQKSMMPLMISQNPQATGSFVTYWRRYQYCSLLGISPEDDDGQAAVAQEIKKKEKVLINDEQVKNLALLFENCEPTYVSTAWDYLKKTGVQRLEDLPLDLYNRIHAGALKNQIQRGVA